MEQPLLELSNITKRFGGLTAVSDVSFTLEPGRIKAVIGPNGAGKTTLFNLIGGVFPPNGGSIRFDGHNIHTKKPHIIAKRGISRTFQTAQVFPNLTILENVAIGRHYRSHAGVWRVILKTPGARSEEKAIVGESKRWLEFIGVKDNYHSYPGDLPFVVQRKIEIARALATEPRLILLDEPAAGLNMRETDEMGELIQKICSAGITVLLIEHDMSLVMTISEEICVLNFGSKIAEGSPREIQRNEDVLAAYLGSEKKSLTDNPDKEAPSRVANNQSG